MVVSSGNKRLRELVAVNRALTGTLKYGEVLRLVVDKATELTGADACALLLANGQNRVHVAASRGIAKESADKVDTPLNEGLGLALRRMLGFGEEDDFIGAPVMSQGQIEGLLVVFRRGPATAGADEEFLLGALADQAAIALEHAHRFEEMTRISGHQQRLLETIQSNTTTALAYLDGDFRFVEANVAYCSVFGLARDELLGRSHGEVFGDARVAAVLETIRDQGELGELKEIAVSAVGADPKPLIWWNWSARPIRGADGSVEALVVSAVDITEAVQSRRALEAEARRKDEFLAMLAHELRNPLAAIHGAVELLRQPEKLDEKVLTHLKDAASRQIAHMSRLLDDLLDVSRITHGKIALEREILDLNDIIKQAVESTLPLASASREEFSVSLPDEILLVDGDPRRLVQVVSNLLANAVKFSDSTVRIELSVRRAGDTAEVHIRDEGLGIHPDVLAKVFDLFVQSERPLAREHGGLGIGLTVVKRMVEMHKGTVEARSKGLGQGSEFVICLPIATRLPQSPAPAAPMPSKANKAAGLRVLLVEDNADVADMLGRLLKLQGHDVVHAADGPTSLEIVRDWNPDVVLLDIGLPGMDGYEVARRVRNETAGPGPRLIALSGYGQKVDRDKAREAGIDEYLVKPASDQALRQALGS